MGGWEGGREKRGSSGCGWRIEADASLRGGRVNAFQISPQIHR